jgi:N-acetylglucosamine kinase-like BadF-type ATPase
MAAELPTIEPDLSDRRLLAVDAGQSSTRAARSCAGDPGVGPGVGHLGAPGAVERVAAAILAAAGLPDGGVDTVCVGLSGLADAGPLREGLAALLAQRLGARRVILASDAVTSYLGALGARPGVVLAAGTGSVALAADGQGADALVDGWGHLLGDAGSGFAIGRAGLDAALRAHDGRGGSEALLARARARFGPLDDLPAAIHGAQRPVEQVAAFAAEVAEAARAGCEPARAIWTTAGSELATSAIAAAERALGPGTPAPVSWAGGLFGAGDLLLAPLRRHLADRAPQLRLESPAGSSLDGARQLDEPGARRALGRRIWTWEAR